MAPRTRGIRLRILIERALLALRSTRTGRRWAVRGTVRRRLREEGLVVQCAWCGRVSDGDGQWAHLPRLSLAPAQVTATICPACLQQRVRG